MSKIKCKAFTKAGTPCNYAAKSEGLCGTHLRLKKSRLLNKDIKTKKAVKEEAPHIPGPDCAICLDEIGKKNRCELTCSHIYHLSCVKKLHDALCPQCRAPLDSPSLTQDDILIMKRKHAEDIIDHNLQQAQEYAEEDDEDGDQNDIDSDEPPGLIIAVPLLPLPLPRDNEHWDQLVVICCEMFASYGILTIDEFQNRRREMHTEGHVRISALCEDIDALLGTAAILMFS
ncbi:MAG: RING finger domain-containing protein [Candidatus Roizmanbacteria bacterium]